MICNVINEGTAPRYALEGSQPTSKPVAPNGFSHMVPRGQFLKGQTAAEAEWAAGWACEAYPVRPAGGLVAFTDLT